LTDVSLKAKNFENKTYLIAHGTADGKLLMMGVQCWN